MDRNDSVVSKPNDLIETCRDGERGFREAAQHVRDEVPALERAFKGE